MAYKSFAIVEQLASQFAQRGYTSLTITKGSTAGGDATLSVGPGTANGANIFIIVSVLPSTPADLNILGTTGFQYAPALIQFATEDDYTSLTAQRLLDFINICTSQGAITKWYKSADGVAPTAGTIVAGNLVATWTPDAVWANLSST